MNAERRWFAVGDPQAPLATLLAVLDAHGLLDGDRLDPGVGLVAIGDYFDFGRASERARAGVEGVRVVDWLADHAPEQVVMLAGNHDLGRIGELVGFDEETFEAAHRRAKAIYGERGDDVDLAAQRAFCADYPTLPTVEVAARDFASFVPAQREQVERLLDARRLRLAHAHGSILMSHAGVTRRELAVLGLDVGARARTIAAALDEALHRAYAAWRARPPHAREPFDVPDLHHAGTASRGEGVGMLYHRPVNPEAVDEPRLGQLARRYDARTIVPGLVQVVGHVSDEKCRTLMRGWCDDVPHRDGVIRHLRTDGVHVQYRAGPPHPARPTSDDEAIMVFVDGGMNRVDPGSYALYPLGPASPGS